MQFYRITHPDGRLEFSTVQTEAAKRAKEIGGQSEAIEVATDKRNLLTFFNELAGSAPTPAASSADEADEGPIQQPASSGKEEHCPKCRFTRRQAENYVTVQKRSLAMDALKEWIEERDGWQLSTIVETITHRLSELAQIAAGKKKAG